MERVFRPRAARMCELSHSQGSHVDLTDVTLQDQKINLFLFPRYVNFLVRHRGGVTSVLVLALIGSKLLKLFISRKRANTSEI